MRGVGEDRQLITHHNLSISCADISLPTIEFSNNYSRGYGAVSIRLADVVEDSCAMPRSGRNGRSVLMLSATEASSRLFSG